MRITCPSCAAEYDLPAALPAGRVVRCVRCGHEWTPAPLPPMVEMAPPLRAPDPEPAFTPPTPRPFLAPPADARPPSRTITRPRRDTPSRAPLVLAWLSSAVLLMALLAAIYVFREPIMRAWPPSTRLYAALGLG